MLNQKKHSDTQPLTRSGTGCFIAVGGVKLLKTVCCFMLTVWWCSLFLRPAYSMLRGPRYPTSTVVLSPAQQGGQPHFSTQYTSWSSTPAYSNGSPQKNVLWSVDRSPYSAVTQRSPHNVTHWHFCDFCV